MDRSVIYFLVCVTLFCQACHRYGHKVELTPQIGAERELLPGLNELYYRDGQRFWLYFPHSTFLNPLDKKILVLIHGYLGRKNDAQGRKRVVSQLSNWKNFAEVHGLLLLLPQFDEKRFRDGYQTLNVSHVRADIRLNSIVRELESLIEGIDTQRLLLFGFSGGGQFVHRYASFQPHKIFAAVAASAGWYTFPDPTLPYPLGTDTKRIRGTPHIKMEHLHRVNLLILVGEDDTDQSYFRHRYGLYDLDELQGPSRYERALNWYRTMQQLDQANDSTLVFLSVPRTGHARSVRLLGLAQDFLAGHLGREDSSFSLSSVEWTN